MSDDDSSYDPKQGLSENNKPTGTKEITPPDPHGFNDHYKIGDEFMTVDAQQRIIYREILERNTVNGSLALGRITRIRIPLTNTSNKDDTEDDTDYGIGQNYVYEDTEKKIKSTHKIKKPIYHNANMITPTHLELGPADSTSFGGKRRRRRKSRKTRRKRRKSRKTKRKRRKSRKTKKRRRRRRR